MSEASVPTAVAGAGAPESGLSTFVFTDIEGSTRLWEEQAAAMGAALALHDRILRDAVERHGGLVVKTTGDGMLAVFRDPLAAVTASLDAQRTLRDAPWGTTGALRVRMAVHSGAAESRDSDFFGPALNRGARILAIGHGGQVLLSAVAAVLSRDRILDEIELVDLGSHRLRDLDRPEQVFQVVVADLPRDFPPLRSLSTRRSNLPVQLTSFVGRERERAEVERLIGRARLVTLIGTGGTGKTRLLLEAAGAVAGRFADGVWLAELAPLGDGGQIAPEIARALGAPELPGRPAFDTVAEFVAAKDLLLLLDNAEHLIDPVADIASRLLAAAPGLRIMATSREALAVPGEAVIQVPSLSCPGTPAAHQQGVASVPINLEEAAATEAVRLFAERAAAVLPSFVLSGANVASISEICRRLDGIPLAIELAAARVSAMSPDDIAQRLGDRFRLLAGGRRTAVPRQQTLHALIDWSWDLLTEDDRQLLRRLSVFAGGWTADAADAVVADGMGGSARGPGQSTIGQTLDGLARLVDRSLVIMDRGATTRYRMLETIRQYAREKLIESGEAQSIADRHLVHFLHLAEAAVPGLHGPAMVDWLDRLDADLENLRAALEWAREGPPEPAIRLAIAMFAYWQTRVMSADNMDRVVGVIDVARALVRGPDVTRVQRSLACHLLGQAAWTWASAGQGAASEAWGIEAFELARGDVEPRARIAAHAGHGISGVFAGRPIEQLRGELEEAIRLMAEAEDWWTLAMAAGGVASSLVMFDVERAERLLAVAANAAERTGNAYVIAITAMAYGRVLGHVGRVEESEARYGEAIARFPEFGDVRFALVSRSDLGHVLRRAGRLDDAVAIYRETIGAWVQLGNRGAVANQLESIAFVAIARGDSVRAARLLGAAESLREAAGSPMAVNEEPEYRWQVERLRAAAPPGDVDAAWAAGRAMPVTDAVTEAACG